MLPVFKTFSFSSPPKKAHVRKDRDFHSNRHTLRKALDISIAMNTWLIFNHKEDFINVSGRKGKLLYAACETTAVERNCLSDPSFV